jgi:hypothetical protein
VDSSHCPPGSPARWRDVSYPKGFETICCEAFRAIFTGQSCGRVLWESSRARMPPFPGEVTHLSTDPGRGRLTSACSGASHPLRNVHIMGRFCSNHGHII